MKFSHAGNIGDLLYSTLFMSELTEATEQRIEAIHLQIGKKATYSQPHVYGDVQLTEAAAEFLAPLLNYQGWKTTISCDVPDGYIDLDQFRKQRLNFAASDCRLWYYTLVNLVLPMNMRRSIIQVKPNTSYRDKIIVIRTSRYNNHFLDWNVLKPYQKDIIMLGLSEEHSSFCEKFFPIDYLKVNNALEAAEIIAGSKFIVGNQCGLFSIAEMMKTPRILTTAEFITIKHPKTNQDLVVPGPCNVLCQGGKCALASTTAKFEAVLKEMNRICQSR